MDYIEVSAKTIADAVAKGTEQLKADGKVVTDTKVLEQPSSGFLGIGRRDALVRLYFEEAPLTEKVAFAAEQAAANVQATAQTKVAEAKTAVSEASEFVQEKVADAKSTAVEVAEAAEQKFNEVAEAAQQKAGEVSELAQQKFGEVKEQAAELADKAQQHLGEAADAAQAKIANVKAQAKDVAVDVKDTVADTLADAKETAEDAATTVAAAVKPQREPVSKEEQMVIADKGKQFLQDMFSKMGLSVQIEKMMTAEKITFQIHGEELGILIGKHGQTLDAIQYLTNLVANKEVAGHCHIVVDVENYRSRREETLVNLAKRLASKVKRNRQKISLEPMSAFERKIIHLTLQNEVHIVTDSEGEEPYRHVVIAYKR
ncbi:MAG: KH domain-containing protein [Veillonella sp.]|uniref:RNA-binding cell elongation regulator Jag/EloR n=1 Tax=Veillonella sp. TaxID=1926307 RepID=UPI001EC42D22|nr:RNA-binding cell elongation regulator Jag/EloR [Veillonella sp.]MBS5271081.1 KH domain-containing protein [Veillonella sp.]